jgi:hypothetical protein
MKGRRTAAMLCVLLGHALLVFALMNLTRTGERRMAAPPDPEFFSELLALDAQERDEIPPLRIPQMALAEPAAPSLPADAAAASEAEASSALTVPGYVDWPRERRDAAARVLAAEAEAERVAKLFAGPQGTWASLTKRQRSQLNKFRWKPGVNGLERDERGNTIYQLGNGCVLVNFVFFGCPIGAKPPARGDMFDNMREYFDEQRLPLTDEGNGREPESMRPPKWSKPLDEKD